ncbi:hypothetical protein MBVG596_0857 [Mycoplasmopsis bovigenitalium]|uniref:hypothetical protein n=1 Tax=Mycoplasmopsis bovigenitalium TaxID=2112 RepID=UPI00090A9AB7|nr:hypothetical protein [Mycoplasmopsis bovigenitalium]BAW18446.1 hypothetical protein MBVG596_0857 [Mycoplasmopsis bovigenitalium]
MRSKTRSLQVQSPNEFVLDIDQTLFQNEIYNLLKNNLLADNLSLIKIDSKKYIEYKYKNNKYIIFAKSVSYLGRPHPLDKKRIQISKHFKSIYTAKKYSNYIFIILGVYKYNDSVVFSVFEPTQYFKRMSNNSSAHVNTDDISFCLEKGEYFRKDKNGNEIRFYNRTNIFKIFEPHNIYTKNSAVNYEWFDELLIDLPIKTEINVMDAVREMKQNNFKHWKQSEWPGFYLEFLLKKELLKRQLKGLKYLDDDNINKNHDNLDFDFFFEDEQFFADVKSSDINETKTIGNDLENVKRALEKYKKFWYIIFEHKTVKDYKLPEEFKLVKEWNKLKNKEKLNSYEKKLKNSVTYENVLIVEYTLDNFEANHDIYNQGHQPDGSKRKPKILINKKNENIIIFKKKI